MKNETKKQANSLSHRIVRSHINRAANLEETSPMDSEKKDLRLLSELIEEILLRLPVKSLVRFKSVSKHWLSLILDTRFTKSHFDLAAAPTDRLLYATQSGSEARWVDVDASIRRDCAVVRLPVPYHNHLMIKVSCRGFILLENYLREPPLVLWNPLTRAHKAISYSSVALKALRRSGFHRTCGFGYDKASDDFLVVIGCCERPGPDSYISCWEVFSVRGDSWKEVEGVRNPDVTIPINCGSGVFLEGAIHWLATKQHGGVEAPRHTPNVIIAFDLVGNDFSEITLPNVPLSDVRGCYFWNLKLLGERLSVCYRKGKKQEIWVMKEYKAQSSWAKHNVVLPYFTISTPVCFTKGDGVVATNDWGQLVKFNRKGKFVEQQPDHDVRRTVAMFTGTLLSLPGNAREDGH